MGNTLKKKKHFPVCMTEDEKKFFIKNISKSKNYLEFGAGGSTCLTLMKSKATVNVVESDPKWLETMRTWKEIKRGEKQNRLFLNHIDIGEVGDWGMPKDKTKEALFPNYSSEIFKKINPKNIDTFFIDGRFRVACLLCTILNSDAKANIIVHDFWNRPEYHVVLEFLDAVDSAETMCLLRKKQNIDTEKIKTLYDTYKYIMA